MPSGRQAFGDGAQTLENNGGDKAMFMNQEQKDKKKKSCL